MIRSKNEYLRIRDKLFIILLLTLMMDATCLALGQLQSISDYSFTLHELFFIPINISILAIPIELIMFIYYSTKYFKNIRKTTILMDLGYKIKIFIYILCMAFTIGLFCYQLNEDKISTISTITNKIIEGQDNYIMVNNIKIKCTKNEYNLINVKEEYFIGYKWNRLKPNVIKLDNINPTAPYKKNK